MINKLLTFWKDLKIKRKKKKRLKDLKKNDPFIYD